MHPKLGPNCLNFEDEKWWGERGGYMANGSFPKGLWSMNFPIVECPIWIHIYNSSIIIIIRIFAFLVEWWGLF